MNNKEILDKNAKEILRRILQGESLSKIQREYDIDKGTITDYYRKLFENDKRALDIFDMVLQNKKARTSTIEIDDKKLENSIQRYLKGSLNLKQAGKELGISEQTFKKKMLLYLEKHENLQKEYDNKKAKRADYKELDFKKLAVEMLENNFTQKEMEEKYDLKCKTLSKKISGFDNDTDRELHNACKILAEAMMNKQKLSHNEIQYIENVVKKYKMKFKEEEEKER